MESPETPAAPEVLDPPEPLSPGAFAKALPAHLLKNGVNINSLRTNTLLRKDEWQLLDTRIVEIAENTLRGMAELLAAGLTIPLGGLGILISQFETLSILDDRFNDNMFVGIPAPIISRSFRIDARSLFASRMHGGLLDTTHVDTATRKVAEMLEYILFHGSTLVQRGQVIYDDANFFCIKQPCFVMPNDTYMYFEPFLDRCSPPIFLKTLCVGAVFSRVMRV